MKFKVPIRLLVNDGKLKIKLSFAFALMAVANLHIFYLQLHPVMARYKTSSDLAGLSQMGLVFAWFEFDYGNMLKFFSS